MMRMKPSDVALVDGLPGPCSLRVFMRRVRKAFSRASIGGRQVSAVQTAQNATKVAAATTITKAFSEATRSMSASDLDGRDLVHHEDAEAHAAGRSGGHHLAGFRGEQDADIARRNKEQAATDQERQ